MDADSTARKMSHDDILSAFRAGKADVLLGTQMIAKGLDFPNVTLVGVLNADVSLHRPDPRRAPEEVGELDVARTEGQFDALVSFAYNVGIGRLRRSTLLRVIREGGSRSAIRREFKKWVFAGGRKLRGLELRREWEAKRFFE